MHFELGEMSYMLPCATPPVLVTLKKKVFRYLKAWFFSVFLTIIFPSAPFIMIFMTQFMIISCLVVLPIHCGICWPHNMVHKCSHYTFGHCYKMTKPLPLDSLKSLKQWVMKCTSSHTSGVSDWAPPILFCGLFFYWGVGAGGRGSGKLKQHLLVSVFFK